MKNTAHIYCLLFLCFIVSCRTQKEGFISVVNTSDSDIDFYLDINSSVMTNCRFKHDSLFSLKSDSMVNIDLRGKYLISNYILIGYNKFDSSKRGQDSIDFIEQSYREIKFTIEELEEKNWELTISLK